jgi:hypothetical protein
MDIFDENLYQKAIIRGNLMFFYPNEAILFINKCKSQNRKILGIDAFKITETSTQPVSEHSIDFSFKEADNWSESIKFIEERAKLGLVFEVIFD